uniref:Uncharacterized protein n=1 Tax=Cannabis sativa TaxID=3483 RepID=A0A803R6D6_CANSA
MEVESPPGFSMDQSDDERAELSISELICNLRSAFRISDFDRVEEILINKENKMKKQITELESEIIQFDLEVKRLRIVSSENRISRENDEIMEERE